MATFNQQGQSVHTQYNAETINFNKVSTADDFRQQLLSVQSELQKAREAGAVTDDQAIDAEYQLNKALAQAKKPAPDRKTLVEHLSSAKDLVSGVSGLATAIAGAITAVGVLF